MPIFAECVRRGTRAQQPLASAVTGGTLYFVTDEKVTERSNEAIWETYSPTGVLSGTLANQPTGLGPANAGLLYQVLAPYYHTCRWNGTAWEFAPGDCGNGFFEDRPVPPQTGGYQVCDGTVTDYLKVGGASLTTQAFTTPALAGYYRKAAAAYTGVGVAAAGSSTSAATGTTALDGPTGTALDGPTATGAADRALIANTGGPTSTGACDRVLSATSSANPEGYTAGSGGHGHGGSYTDTVGDHAHYIAAHNSGGASGNIGADSGSGIHPASDGHTHWMDGRWSDNGGAHSHGVTVIGVGDHTHWFAGHSHTVTAPDHLHTLAQHTHTVTDHLHGIAQHTHGIAQHTHGLGGHTHTVGATEPAYVGVPVYFRR